MKVKITKPIKVTEVGPYKLKIDEEVEVSDDCGKVLVSKKYATEVKEAKKANKAGDDKKAK
tara:strand:+ start:37 stop:219 length:183 start_codon:yes stop_codon:yes gene_type:complete